MKTQVNKSTFLKRCFVNTVSKKVKIIQGTRVLTLYFLNQSKVKLYQTVHLGRVAGNTASANHWFN